MVDERLIMTNQRRALIYLQRFVASESNRYTHRLIRWSTLASSTAGSSVGLACVRSWLSNLLALAESRRYAIRRPAKARLGISKTEIRRSGDRNGWKVALFLPRINVPSRGVV